MEAIKNLFKLKNNPVSEVKPTDNEVSLEQIRITYYQSGYGASIKA
jgi:hypothetical protein